MLVLEGTGKAGGRSIAPHFGIRVDPDETASLTADTTLTLLSFRLPPVASEWTQPLLPSFEPVPGESVGDPV